MLSLLHLDPVSKPFTQQRLREIEFLTPCEVTILSDRRERGPYGLCGGEPGEPGRNTLDGRIVPAKANFPAQAGAVLRIETPGGGGWGS